MLGSQQHHMIFLQRHAIQRHMSQPFRQHKRRAAQLFGYRAQPRRRCFCRIARSRRALRHHAVSRGIIAHPHSNAHIRRIGDRPHIPRTAILRHRARFARHGDARRCQRLCAALLCGGFQHVRQHCRRLFRHNPLALRLPSIHHIARAVGDLRDQMHIHAHAAVGQ